jgi:spore coat polysaccharide biosynthesis protein SpsF
VRTAIVLQARMGSTRLPGKALLPLGGRTVVDQAMARLSLVPADARVLATDEASERALAPAAERNGFELVVGPAEDVLARYCIAARGALADLVLRATGDNPLVSYELAALLLERRASAPSDYAAQTGMPLGMGTELVSAEALFRAESEARLPAEREHVCPYLYNHPEIFRIDRSEAPPAYRAPGLRATVDTLEDYEAALRVYGALYDGDPIPTEAAIAYLARAAGAPKERP